MRFVQRIYTQGEMEIIASYVKSLNQQNTEEGTEGGKSNTPGQSRGLVWRDKGTGTTGEELLVWE